MSMFLPPRLLTYLQRRSTPPTSLLSVFCLLMLQPFEFAANGADQWPLGSIADYAGRFLLVIGSCFLALKRFSKFLHTSLQSRHCSCYPGTRTKLDCTVTQTLRRFNVLFF